MEFSTLIGLTFICLVWSLGHSVETDEPDEDAATKTDSGPEAEIKLADDQDYLLNITTDFDETNVTSTVIATPDGDSVADDSFIFKDEQNNTRYVGMQLDQLHLNLTEMRHLLLNDSELSDIVERHKDATQVQYSPDSYLKPLFDKVRYDNNTAPQLFSDIPVVVKTGLYIQMLSDFNVRQMHYQLDADLILRWRDVRLRHNFSHPILVRNLNILERLWRPDPFIVDAREESLHQVTRPKLRLLITNSGLITFTFRRNSAMGPERFDAELRNSAQNLDSDSDFTPLITHDASFYRNRTTLVELRLMRTQNVTNF